MSATTSRIVVVTGAGSGLGRRTAHVLADEGATVVVLDLDPEAAEATVEELALEGREGLALESDVTSPDSVSCARDTVLERFGRIDGLVNNAGILTKTPLLEESFDAWQRTMTVNLGGYFLCLQAFGSSMAAAGAGSIVNIASIGATTPTIGAGAYCASKAGVLALTRQAAVELGPLGVRVNAVSPGFMKTAMTQDRYAVSGLEERRAALIPLRRVAGGFLHSTTANVAQPS